MFSNTNIEGTADSAGPTKPAQIARRPGRKQRKSTPKTPSNKLKGPSSGSSTTSDLSGEIKRMQAEAEKKHEEAFKKAKKERRQLADTKTVPSTPVFGDMVLANKEHATALEGGGSRRRKGGRRTPSKKFLEASARWRAHLAEYRRKHPNMSLKQQMKGAKKTYKKYKPVSIKNTKYSVQIRRRSTRPTKYKRTRKTKRRAGKGKKKFFGLF